MVYVQNVHGKNASSLAGVQRDTLTFGFWQVKRSTPALLAKKYSYWNQDNHS